MSLDESLSILYSEKILTKSFVVLYKILSLIDTKVVPILY